MSGRVIPPTGILNAVAGKGVRRMAEEPTAGVYAPPTTWSRSAPVPSIDSSANARSAQERRPSKVQAVPSRTRISVQLANRPAAGDVPTNNAYEDSRWRHRIRHVGGTGDHRLDSFSAGWSDGSADVVNAAGAFALGSVVSSPA